MKEDIREGWGWKHTHTQDWQVLFDFRNAQIIATKKPHKKDRDSTLNHPWSHAITLAHTDFAFQNSEAVLRVIGNELVWFHSRGHPSRTGLWRGGRLWSNHYTMIISVKAWWAYQYLPTIFKKYQILLQQNRCFEIVLGLLDSISRIPSNTPPPCFRVLWNKGVCC